MMYSRLYKMQRTFNSNLINNIVILKVLLLLILLPGTFSNQPHINFSNLQLAQVSQKQAIRQAIVLTSTTCYEPCLTCTSTSPYSCTSCKQGYTPYLFSCQNLLVSYQSPVIIVFCVLTTMLFVFMILLGYGVYRQIFQCIQVTSLISWGYSSSMGAYPLQGTNLGLQYNNSFWQSFSLQFIGLMVIWLVFWIAIIIAYRYPNKPISVLLMRKQTIFPVRLFMFFYNIILYTAMIDVVINIDENDGTQDLFGYILSILAITKVLVVLAIMIFACNWKRLKPDDPNNYIFLEKIKGTRWWIRNNTVFSIITKAIIISSYVIGFTTPLIAGIIMLIAQGIFIIYFCIFLRFKETRYFVFNLTGAILLQFLLLSSFVCAISEIESEVWYAFRVIHFTFTIALCCIFLIAGIIQLVVYKSALKRQIISLFRRFIICKSIDKEVEKNKFDETYGREKVTQYKQNLLYKRNLTELQPFPKQAIRKKEETILNVQST